MSDLVQQGVATIIALACAVWIIVRIARAGRTAHTGDACGACPAKCAASPRNRESGIGIQG